MSSRASRKEAARAAREMLVQQRRRRTRLVTAVAVAVLLAAALTGYAVYAAQDTGDDFAVPASATSDRAGLRVGDGPVTVEVYLDFLCPACRAFEADAGSTRAGSASSTTRSRFSTTTRPTGTRPAPRPEPAARPTPTIWWAT